MSDLVGNRFIGLVVGSIIGFAGAAMIAGAINLIKKREKVPEKKS